MSGFTKLSSEIITSTIWLEDDATLRVWIGFLALTDASGFVAGSVPGLASLCRVSLEQMQTAIGKFESPDLHSRTKEYEGRRIESVDGGWRILNYSKWREKGRHPVASLQTKGYVYYAADPSGGAVKIGFSKNPWARLGDLRVTNPKIELLATEPGSMELEKSRHQQFKSLRVEGEWFKWSDVLRKHILEIKSQKQTTTVAATVATPHEEAEAEAEAEDRREIALSAPSSAKLTDDQFLEALKKNKAYEEINIEKELGKMDAWLSTQGRGRKKTRRFIVNWLNRIETSFRRTSPTGPKKVAV